MMMGPALRAGDSIVNSIMNKAETDPSVLGRQVLIQYQWAFTTMRSAAKVERTFTYF